MLITLELISVAPYCKLTSLFFNSGLLELILAGESLHALYHKLLVDSISTCTCINNNNNNLFI